MKRGLGASWLPRVGWEGFGKVQNGSQECGGSQEWGGKDGNFCCWGPGPFLNSLHELWLSFHPGEMPFSKNKLKENILRYLCQVCLVTCRFAKNKLKENMLRQAGQIECQFEKENMFVK